MKRTLYILTLVLFANAALAKTAVVDTDYVLEHAEITKQANKKIMANVKTEEEKIQTKNSELEKERESLIAKKSVLSKEELTKREKEFKEKYVVYSRDVQAAKNKLAAQNKNLKQEVANIISNVVEEVAKKQKYKMVIAKSFLIYTDGSDDITEEVLKEVNKKSLKK